MLYHRVLGAIFLGTSCISYNCDIDPRRYIAPNIQYNEKSSIYFQFYPILERRAIVFIYAYEYNRNTLSFIQKGITYQGMEAAISILIIIRRIWKKVEKIVKLHLAIGGTGIRFVTFKQTEASPTIYPAVLESLFGSCTILPLLSVSLQNKVFSFSNLINV